MAASREASGAAVVTEGVRGDGVLGQREVRAEAGHVGHHERDDVRVALGHVLEPVGARAVVAQVARGEVEGREALHGGEEVGERAGLAQLEAAGGSAAILGSLAIAVAVAS